MYGQEAAEYNRDLQLKRICCICKKELKQTQHGGKNQMDDALDIEIRGYWGSTVFDGTDITGECYLGFVCDECGKTMIDNMTLVAKYKDHRIKPGSPEWNKLVESLK